MTTTQNVTKTQAKRTEKKGKSRFHVIRALNKTKEKLGQNRQWLQ